MRTQTCEDIAKKKTNSILRHLEHLDLAQKQRMDYQQGYILSKKAFREIVNLNLNNHPVEMNSVKANVTLSFDFTQMVHYPNTSDQVGCLYFIRYLGNVHFLGLQNEGLGTQVKYLIDEIVDCGKGSNAVISYIHDYLNKHSFGVCNLSLQADNCSGQYKNNFFIFYIVSRMLKKMHDRITYNFLLEGHTKFTPDRCFDLIEQNYRRAFASLIFHVAIAVNNSAGVDSAELCSVSSRM